MRATRRWALQTLSALALSAALSLACGGTEGGSPPPPTVEDGPANPTVPADPAAPAAPPSDPLAPVDPAGIAVSFKLDPRLTTGLYMGERWVSPRVFSIALDGEGFIEARAECLETDDLAQWTSADGELLAVAPSRAARVRITIRSAGETTLGVACGALRGSSRSAPTSRTACCAPRSRSEVAAARASPRDRLVADAPRLGVGLAEAAALVGLTPGRSR